MSGLTGNSSADEGGHRGQESDDLHEKVPLPHPAQHFPHGEVSQSPGEFIGSDVNIVPFRNV
ncbi:hypothetical protein OHA88_10140 [Streptomyces sp. NBC_00353]|uniref:hypothetical protein n=1 Tax=Streptomyces sp. NBC_00353 TaxID=2975722 RepID=UPI002E262A2B